MIDKKHSIVGVVEHETDSKRPIMGSVRCLLAVRKNFSILHLHEASYYKLISISTTCKIDGIGSAFAVLVLRQL